jgi:anti-sigma B factor antagonist
MTISADRPLQLDVRRENGNVVISAHGNIDVLDAPMLQEQLQELVRESRRLVVLDLSDLDFIGPDGLDVLLTVRKALKVHKGQIRLVHPHPEIRRMLQVTRLTKILPIFDTVEQALG